MLQLLVLTFHYTFSSCHYRYGSLQSVLWHEQQFSSSCHIGPVLRSHSVRVRLLPLQTQVGAAKTSSHNFSHAFMSGELYLPKWKIYIYILLLFPLLYPFLYFLVFKRYWECQSSMSCCLLITINWSISDLIDQLCMPGFYISCLECAAHQHQTARGLRQTSSAADNPSSNYLVFHIKVAAITLFQFTALIEIDLVGVSNLKICHHTTQFPSCHC